MVSFLECLPATLKSNHLVVKVRASQVGVRNDRTDSFYCLFSFSLGTTFFKLQRVSFAFFSTHCHIFKIFQDNSYRLLKGISVFVKHSRQKVLLENRQKLECLLAQASRCFLNRFFG